MAIRRGDPFLKQLQKVPLFTALSKKDLKLVSKSGEDLEVPAGHVLVEQGAAGAEFFVIVSGAAKVTRNGRKVATLKPGSFFGDLALLDKAPRNASVISETPMELVVVGQRQFGGLIDSVPGFARKLLAGMAARLREADSQSVQ